MISFKPTKEKTIVAVYAFLALAAVAAFCCVLMNLGAIWGGVRRFFGVIAPIIGGFAIAYLCDPLYLFFVRRVFAFTERKKPHPRLRRYLSVTLVFIVVLTAASLLLSLFIPQLVASYTTLSSSISTYAAQAEKLVVDFVNSLPFSAERYERLSEFVDINRLSSELGAIITGGYNIVDTIVTYGVSYASAIASGVGDVIMSVILSVYFLLARDKLIAQINKILSALFKPKRLAALKDFAALADRTFGGYVKGAMLDALIVATESFIVFSVFGIPYAPLIAVIVGVTNIIPYFGPFIGAIPSALLIVIADPPKAIVFLILILVIQQIDGNLIAPRIMNSTTGLSALWVVTALTIFGDLFGFFGLLFGIPIFAMFYETFKRVVERRLAARELPTETRDYYPEGEAPVESDKPSLTDRLLARLRLILSKAVKTVGGAIAGAAKATASAVKRALCAITARIKGGRGKK